MAGTRSDVVEKIHASLTTILKNEEVRNRIMAIGFEPMGVSGVGISTLIDRTLMAVVMALYVLKSKNFKIFLKEFKILPFEGAPWKCT